MCIQDEEMLKRLDSLFPIRARLVSIHSGDKGRFELTDHQGNEVEIDGVSPLRIILNNPQLKVRNTASQR